MSTLLFAFVAVLVVSTGGREWQLAARLSQRLGNTTALMVAGIVASALSAAAMAFSGALIGKLMPGPAQMMLVAIALLIAAAELAWPRKARLPQEPTRSFVPILIVLIARQIGDAARFLVFAFAAAGSPAAAGIGGSLGGIAAIAVAISAGAEIEARLPLRKVRVIIAVLLAVVAVALGLSARGIID